MDNNITIWNALKYGNIFTKLSIVVFGLGSLVHKQIARFILLFGAEIIYLIYMVTIGFNSLVNMVTLGTVTQQESFNEALGIFEYTRGDNSMLFLLYGVITLAITAAFFVFMVTSIKYAYAAQLVNEQGTPQPKFRDDLKSLSDTNLHKALLTFPIIGLLIFTVIPLVFMILIAFTNFDHMHQPPGNLFDWVGITNFVQILSTGGRLTHTFWRVLGWTLIWAFCATFSNYFLGMLLAITINRKDTKCKKMWRFIFALSIALPAFVSLLTMRTIFHANGAMNVLLRNWGIIEATASVRFFTHPTIAKVMVIVINIWIGVPYTLMNTTGILQNIPSELYESARVDGAGAWATFRKITLPYMNFVMAPALITAFVGNVNNFNVIFLLTGGGPDTMMFYQAGRTDLLVTWLFRLTITHRDYNLGSVIAIFMFVLMAGASLLTYSRIGSYKDEEAFQK